MHHRVSYKVFVCIRAAIHRRMVSPEVNSNLNILKDDELVRANNESDGEEVFNKWTDGKSVLSSNNSLKTAGIAMRILMRYHSI